MDTANASNPEADDESDLGDEDVIPPQAEDEESEADSLDDVFSDDSPPEAAPPAAEQGVIRYVCSSCGKKYPPDEKTRYCSYCGARVNVATDVAAIDTKARVMIVEDSTVSRLKISGILKDLSCEIVEAEDGQEAIAKVMASPPDLIILDVHMPNTDGIQFLRALRGSERHAAISVVMMTADSDADVVSQALALNALDYIRKGDSVENIKSRLAKHISNLKH